MGTPRGRKWEELKRYRLRGTFDWYCRPEGFKGGPNCTGPIRFWLPSGLGYDDLLYDAAIKDRIEMFNRQEAMYKSWFRLSDEVVRLEIQED